MSSAIEAVSTPRLATRTVLRIASRVVRPKLTLSRAMASFLGGIFAPEFPCITAWSSSNLSLATSTPALTMAAALMRSPSSASRAVA